MRLSILIFHVGLALVAVDVRAQDDTAARDTAPHDDAPRFDLAAHLGEGERALDARDVVRMAVAHSPRVVVTRVSIAAAEAGVRRATAALVPRLDLTARYAHIDGFPDGMIGGGDPAAVDAARALAMTVTDPSARALFLGTIDAQATGTTIRIPRDQFGFAARLSVPISDILLAVLPALHGAEARVHAAELQADAARRDVELVALEAYYRYAEARGVLAVATEARDRVAERVEMVGALLRGGYLTPPDQSAVEAALAQANEGVARAEGAVALARVALGVAIGDRDRALLAVQAALLSAGVPAGSLDELEARALSDRPELAALRESMRAQREMRTATEAGGYPHIGLYLTGDVSNPSPRIIPPREEFTPTWEIGATFSWSPNDLATSIFAAEEIDAAVAGAEAQVLLIEDQVRLELRQAYEATEAARAALEAVSVTLSSAEVAYEARRAQLTAGEGLLDDLEAADLRVTDARLSELRARLELVVAEARLRHALGASLVE
jgi:outer membrane protein TolC